MGQNIEFICRSCSYTTMAARERDHGMMVSYEYVICRDCNSVVPIVVERRGGSDADCDGKCPNCSTSNFNAWMAEARCPRCAETMIEGEAILMWD